MSMNPMTDAMNLAVAVHRSITHIADLIRDISDEADEYSRRTFSGSADGAGAFQAEFHATPGFGVELTSFAIGVGDFPAATTGIVAFYTDEVRGTQLLKANPLTAALISDSFVDGIFVPSGARIIVNVLGAPANAKIEGNVVFKRPKIKADRGRNAGREFQDRYLPAGDVTLNEDQHSPDNSPNNTLHSAMYQ